MLCRLELSALRDEWYHLTGKTQGLYNEVADYYSVPTTIGILTSPSKANKRMETKKTQFESSKDDCITKGQRKKTQTRRHKPWKHKSATNTRIYQHLGKEPASQSSIIERKRLWTQRSGWRLYEGNKLKTELVNAEAQLDTYKSVKDMMSKDELTEKRHPCVDILCRFYVGN